MIHTIEPIYINFSHTLSFLKCMLHTILFQRIPRLVKPKDMFLFDNISYVKIDDSEIDRMIEDKIDEIRHLLGKNTGNKIFITLYKSIKKKGWLGMISEELTQLERWNLSIYITDYDKSFSYDQRDAMLQKRLQQIIHLCDQHKDHLFPCISDDTYTLSVSVNENSANSPIQDIFELLKNGPPKFF